MAKRFLTCMIAGAFLAGCPGDDLDMLSVSGQIEGVDVAAGSRVGGRVAEVLVSEGEAVESGQMLVQLEDDEAQAVVAAAKAQLAQAEAVLKKLEEGSRPEEIEQAEAAGKQAFHRLRLAENGLRSQEVEAARQAVETARAQRDDAAAEYRRARELYEKGVVSEQMCDKAQHAAQAAEAVFQASQQRYSAAVEGTRDEELAMAKASYEQAAALVRQLKNGARAEDVAAARAACDAAKADLERAEAAAREMVVSSPRNGVVESLDVHRGDLVKPGAIVRIVDPEELELWIYVSARVLGKLRLGQQVVCTADSLDDQEFAGAIVHIASQGEFTPRNLQTEEERVQQMFGVKIKLDSAGGKLKAGMTATAHLDLTTEEA